MKRSVLVLPLATGAIMAISPLAVAQDGGYFDDGGVENPDPETGTGGNVEKGVISSEVNYSNSAGDSEAPAVIAPNEKWTPPPCWYEPRTASEAQDHVHAILQGWQNIPDSDIQPSRDRLLNHFDNGDPYENYNLDIENEGAFWFGVPNPNQLDNDAAFECSDELPQWVENGETPDEEEVITAEKLAASAYEWLPIPETAITLNPTTDIPQTVYLPTWVWHDTTDIGEVSATAALERLGLSATTVATPSALTLDPGTEEAIVHPADGECVINDDGTIGEPYDGQSAEEEPPCGVTFTRSTADGEPYELTATITWSVSWTGTGHPEPQPLPDAVLETTHQLTVREVQTIVR